MNVLHWEGPPRAVGRNRLGRRDSGFAMIFVLATASILTATVVVSLAFATNAQSSIRRSQDYQTALQAAQAGIDDYVHHLNVCDPYWDTTSVCYGSQPRNSADTAVTPTGASWAGAPRIPGTAGTSPGQYLYKVVARPLDPGSIGVVRLQSWGHAGKVTRSVLVDLAKPSFLKYVYFTDIDAKDPQVLPTEYPAFTAPSCEYPPNARPGGATTVSNCDYPGVPLATANSACAHHYYNDGLTGTSGTRTNFVQNVRHDGAVYSVSNSCMVYFGANDRIDGPFHTNDAIPIAGSVTFQSPLTETAWDSTDSPPAPSNGNLWIDACGGCQPVGNKPVAADVVGLPPTNASIKDQTAPGTQGCLYTGPTQITLRSDGNMDVVSPYTTSSSPPKVGCYTTLPMTSPQTVALPANGVAFAQTYSGSCTNSVPFTGMLYPQLGDNGPDARGYDCHNGDVFVRGTLKGQLTLAADNNINVVGDTLYAGGLTGTDVLGLVANNFVQAYKPVSCPNYPAFQTNCTYITPAGASGPLRSLEIDAAILSVSHSFRVQNVWVGPGLSDGSTANRLHIRGAVIQKYRGVVGGYPVGSGLTSYNKDYQYDTRLAKLPPPFFLQPTVAPWQISVFKEQ